MAGVAMSCFALNAHAETLEQAVSLTLAHHPQIESALAAVNRAHESQKEQRSAYFPEIEIGATAGRIYGDNSTSRGLTTTRGAGYSNYWDGSISARQQIYDGMETKYRIESAQAEEKAASHTLDDVRETLSFRVVQTYINLTRAYKGLALLRAQQESVNEYLARITSMVDDGAADEAELQQARDVSVILDNFINDYRGQARNLEADYFELTGHAPDDELVIPQTDTTLIPEKMSDAIAQANQSHPLLHAANAQALSAKNQINATKAGYIPRVDGELSFLKSEKDDVLGGELEDGRAVVRANWNFETGGAQAARINQQKYGYKDALARHDNAQRQIERGIRQAYAELETAQKQLENQNQRYDLNAKLMETYEVQFEGALISVLQLMQADNQVLITKLETENAKSRVQLAQYAILAAMGQLNDALGLKIAAKQ